MKSIHINIEVMNESNKLESKSFQIQTEPLFHCRITIGNKAYLLRKNIKGEYLLGKRPSAWKELKK